jgi:hypothetical protein
MNHANAVFLWQFPAISEIAFPAASSKELFFDEGNHSDPPVQVIGSS